MTEKEKTPHKFLNGKLIIPKKEFTGIGERLRVALRDWLNRPSLKEEAMIHIMTQGREPLRTRKVRTLKSILTMLFGTRPPSAPPNPSSLHTPIFPCPEDPANCQTDAPEKNPDSGDSL